MKISGGIKEMHWPAVLAVVCGCLLLQGAAARAQAPAAKAEPPVSLAPAPAAEASPTSITEPVAAAPAAPAPAPSPASTGPAPTPAEKQKAAVAAPASPAPATATPVASSTPAAASPATASSTSPSAAPVEPASAATAPAEEKLQKPGEKKKEAAKDSKKATLTPAELAIVQNAEVLDTLTPPPPTGAAAKKAIGMQIKDILNEEPADIRPLPEKYLIVKKERAANTAESHLMAARLALSRGNNQAALELFGDLYKKMPDDERVAMGRAVAFQRLGQSDAAISAYEAVLARNPRNVEALTNMLGLLQDQNPEAAIGKLRQLRDLYPANADVTAQLGTLYGVAGDYESALRYLDMADALNPGNVGILYNKAIVYDRMGNGAKAVELYRQLIQQAGEQAVAHNFPVEAIKKRLSAIR